jgi:hypothetical protein
VANRILCRKDHASGDVAGKISNVGKQASFVLFLHREDFRRRKDVGIDRMRAEPVKSTTFTSIPRFLKMPNSTPRLAGSMTDALEIALPTVKGVSASARTGTAAIAIARALVAR